MIFEEMMKNEYKSGHEDGKAVGVQKNHTFILRNGEVVDIVNGIARQTRDIPAGDTYVDGVGIGEVGEIVLRDRKRLSEDGSLFQLES